MKILAIIPARGGSKRLPGKNMLELGGKPLIAWTIEEASKSKYISDIIVSTDDEDIARVSEKYGASIPFLRPKELSSDTATTIDAVKHAINYLKENREKEYKYVLLLQPTSPLRIAEDIDNAIELLLEKQADSVISMCECEHSPIWSNMLPNDYNLDGFLRNDYKNVRSQDLPTYYRFNGAIYIANINRLLEESVFNFDRDSYAYIMPQDRSVDIDSELDFKICQVLIEKQNKL